ncbi:glutaminyl-peptide cyclotransferase, partial [Bacteroidota bacterium]
VLFIVMTACKNNVKPKVIGNSEQQKTIFTPSGKKRISVNNLSKDKLIALGSELEFEVITIGKKPKLDSICIFNKGIKIKSYSPEVSSIALNTNDLGLGRKSLKVTGFFDDKTRQDFYYEYYIISNIKPTKYKYKIIKTYRHDIEAYTQGLVYENGVLYEGTGQWGTSSLRKINLEENDIIQTVNLERDIFGEGICVFNNKIFQLTWRSNRGFVYDKETFKLIQEFEYFSEGWGLTTDGEKLIMSDGSNNLYFLDTEYFSEIGRIEVYNDRGPVNMLNELEFINGEIYANIYRQDLIVIIDPETGIVKGEINAESIRPEGVTNDADHAFNGIAVKGNNLLVTGKLWPVLYEIEIVKE